MKYILFLACLFLFASCTKKAMDSANEFEEATYSIELTGKWASPDFTVPAGVHFTNFAGMVHSAQAELWSPGKFATKGVENVAEVGNTTAIVLEIDSAIRRKNALSLILFSAPGPTGKKEATVYCNSSYPFLSFVSMIAPSPDWFIGLSNLNLYRNKKWIADTTIQLYVYDAGTEEGDVFGYSNPATEPQQNISLLDASKATVLANGNASLRAIAELRLVKL